MKTVNTNLSCVKYRKFIETTEVRLGTGAPTLRLRDGFWGQAEKLLTIWKMSTTFALVVMYILSLLLKLKFKRVKKFLSPAPIPIVKNGEIIYKNLVKAKIPLDFLLSKLRLQQIADIKKVAAAFWEPGGKISVFLVSSHQTLTPNDMKIVTLPFSLPTVVIKEGDIDLDALNRIDRTKDWLTDLLKNTYNAKAKDILLATVDDSYCLQVFFK